MQPGFTCKRERVTPMKKTIVFLLACILCAAFAVSACAGVAQADIEKLIVGKWMVAERDGQPLPTNQKVVTTFESSSRAYISSSLYSPAADRITWHNQVEAGVEITDNKLTLTSHPDEHTTAEHELMITGIDEQELTGIQKGSWKVDGNVVLSGEAVSERFVRITDDFSQDIIGTWEGRCISEGSVFDDGQEHRWEYKADGTFVYYVKDGGNWAASANTLNDYFVDGSLLCCRWIENGRENREWWEVSIDGDKMNWTALRKNEDGTPFTAAFEMTKVQ